MTDPYDDASSLILTAYEVLVRLARVVASCPETVLCLIRELHDHKGRLTVNWRIPSSQLHRSIMTALWAEQCECICEHLVDDCPLAEALVSFPRVASARFRPGDRIAHWKYGNGTVTAVDGVKITIQFDAAGEKRNRGRFRLAEFSCPKRRAVNERD